MKNKIVFRPINVHGHFTLIRCSIVYKHPLSVDRVDGAKNDANKEAETFKAFIIVIICLLRVFRRHYVLGSSGPSKACPFRLLHVTCSSVSYN